MAIGMAMVVAPLTTAVMNAVAEAESGIASAVNNAASRLAGLISVVVVALAASLLYRHEVQSLVMDGTQDLHFGVLPDLSSPARAPLEAAFLEAYGVAMLIAAALAGLAAVAGAVLVRPKSLGLRCVRLVSPWEFPARPDVVAGIAVRITSDNPDARLASQNCSRERAR